MDYISNTDEQLAQMLQTMGLSSFEALLADIPKEVRCKALELPAGLTEPEVLATCKQLLEPKDRKSVV